MNWNLNEIKDTWQKLAEQKSTDGYKKFFTPYRFLRSIGWDKISYDNYCLKLQANDLPPETKLVFQYIYDRVQDTLADLMDLSLLNPKVTISIKNQFELFQPAFGREKQAKQFYSDIQRYNDIKQAQNKSPISILDNGSNKESQ